MSYVILSQETLNLNPEQFRVVFWNEGAQKCAFFPTFQLAVEFVRTFSDGDVYSPIERDLVAYTDWNTREGDNFKVFVTSHTAHDDVEFLNGKPS